MPRRLELSKSCPIWIGNGLLRSEKLIAHLKSLKSSHYAIMTDTHVAPLYGEALTQLLTNSGLRASLYAIPPGEEYKTRATKEACENHLLLQGAGRDTCIIGMGGGVVTDLAGFVASTYCRGVPYILIPTSLLAMVDASIGGKTGVNVPEGKNLIGTIYQPDAVFVDPETLATLPSVEIRNGIVEMIKHGLIADREYFDFMRTRLNPIPKNLEEAITRSIAIKGQIVAEDERERGKRRLVNLGHTVGHAIEAASRYQIPHGKAVAMGILAESYLAMQMGCLKSEEFDTIFETLDALGAGLAPEPPLATEKILSCMQMDKKSLGKIPRFVILEAIGKPMEFNGEFCTAVEESLITNCLNWLHTHDLCRR